MIDPAKPLRVLVAEGSSTSAREAITILGLSGHHVEVCDPSPWCLARYSRFVRKFHRCPGLRSDPAGFLAFVEQLIATRHFDVLLPTHEQGLLFARVKERLAGRIAFALPSFESYRAAHNKAGFCRLLDRLCLPQPPTRIMKSESELREAIRFPSVVKTSVGTASRGIWFVRTDGDLLPALYELAASDGFADEVLVQDLIAGTTEKAQSVFCRGRLIGFHAYRQVAAGVGGGEAMKESVSSPAVRDYLEKVGSQLAWHGGLSVDYIMPYDGTAPLLIDCNPRLVEPVNAWRSGSDLVDRKSTRLNSSHTVISYAVFCLKKKNKTSSGFYSASRNTFARNPRCHRRIGERVTPYRPHLLESRRECRLIPARRWISGQLVLF